MILKKDQDCCSLESAKKLKALNVRQDSQWYYRILSEHPEGYRIVLGKPSAFEWFRFSAYTTGELGVLLPYAIIFHEHENDGGYKYYIITNKQSDGHWFSTFCDFGHYTFQYKPKEILDMGAIIEFREKTEAEAKSKILQFLLEQKIIKVEDINK